MICLALLAACGAESQQPEASPAGAQAAASPAPSPTPGSEPSATAPPSPTAAPEPTATAPASPTAAPTTAPSPSAMPTPAPQEPAWTYPIRAAGRQPGDGFVIRHGFQTENTWYNPGDWHTGEDWYALEGDTAGAEVLAVAAGDVVYAGSNYPGRVVIVRHPGDIYSMYGHLDPALAVGDGQAVERGQVLGTVLSRDDDTPNHLHFEIRSFLTADPVNGPAPRYAYRCGPECPPGPGYWPIDAPELPSALGWLNPTTAIATNAWPDAVGEVLVATEPASPTLELWSDLDGSGAPSGPAGTLALTPGVRYGLLESRAGSTQPTTPSAEAYSLWYRLALPDGRSAWAAALAPSDRDTGSDGKPSSVRFNLLPVAIRE